MFLKNKNIQIIGKDIRKKCVGHAYGAQGSRDRERERKNEW